MNRTTESIYPTKPMTACLTAARGDSEAASQRLIEDVAVKDKWNRRKGRGASGTDLGITRRKALVSGGGALVAAAILNNSDSVAAEADPKPSSSQTDGRGEAGTVTVDDGAMIYFKDWGSKSAQPIVFHHGWPLSSDDWDAQMLYFVKKGYRVIAHDRRGHGRSSQVSAGHDMDHYAADVAAVVSHLGLRDAIHIGHSTGGGEALHYVARHGRGRVAKLVLVGAVPPIMLKTAGNPDGMPMDVFDDFRNQLCEAADKRHTEGLREAFARHVDHQCGHHQFRPLGIL